jgi:hypothetical protein
MKTAIKWGIGAVVAVAIAAGLFTWTSSKGQKQVFDIAMEYGFCQNGDVWLEVTADECAMGKQQVYEFAKTNLGYGSNAMVDWCLGVDSWSEAKVRPGQRGGWIKPIIVDLMYLPCPMDDQ